MACILTTSRDFQNLMVQSDLTAKSLLAAATKWQQEDSTGQREKEGALPPIEWLEEYKGKKIVKVGEKRLADLWENTYQQPSEFKAEAEGTPEDAIKLYQELRTIFGPDSVYGYQANDHTVVVGVYKQEYAEELPAEEKKAFLPKNPFAKKGDVNLYVLNEGGTESMVLSPAREGKEGEQLLIKKNSKGPWEVESKITPNLREILLNKLLFQAADLIPIGQEVILPEGLNFSDLGFTKQENGHFKKTAIKTAALHIAQSSSTSYAQRTRDNASRSDVTLALAEDFSTAGEQLTKKAAGIKYAGASLLGQSAQQIGQSLFETLVRRNYGIVPKGITLNIAGNGIYSLSHPQEYYDSLVTEIVKYLLEKGVGIKEIISGGQTGIDEAGIKAAQNLGINYNILAPKGYKYRNANGSDISGDSAGFIGRFNREVTPVQYKVEEKPESQKAVKTVYYLTEMANKEPFRSTKMIWHLPSPSEEVTRQDRENHIIKMLATEELGIGDRIVIDSEMVPSEIIETVKTLKGLKKYKIYSESDPTFIPISDLTAEDLDAFRNAKFTISEDSGVVYIPSFTVGYSQYKLRLLQQEKNLRAEGIFKDTELRALAKAAIFRLSDRITQLLSDSSAGLSLPEVEGSNKFRYRDYTGMSRIDILDEAKGIGLANLLNLVVREEVFNYKRPGSRAEELARKSHITKRKMQLILDNFDAFVRLGYDSLIGLEQVSFIDGFRKIDGISAGETSEIFSQEDEQSIQEVYGSSVEHWQVGFRQVSAITSLSQQIKRKLGKLYQMEKDGTIITDEFGQGKTVDAADVVTRILSWTQGAETLDNMIDMLRKHLASEPWLNQLVGEYYAGGNNTGARVQGILLDAEGNDQFRSQFFSNFKKYFQMYAITYKDASGKTLVKPINTNGYTDSVLKGLATQASQAGNGALRIWNPNIGNFSADFRKLEQFVLGDEDPDRGIFPAAGSLRALLGEESVVDSTPVTDEMLQRIVDAYTILDMQTPSKEELAVIFPTAGDVLAFTTKLFYTIGAIKDSVEDGKLKLFTAKKNARSDYKKLAEMLAPVMGTSVEAVSYEAGKMHYGYVTPAYLGTLVSKLKGRTKNYQEFIDSQYRRFTGWFFSPKVGLPKGLIGSNPWIGPSDPDTGWMNWWLELLAADTEDAAKDRDRLAHIVSLSDNKVSYQDKSDPQYTASLVSMYFYDDNKVNAYFAVPTLSNKPSEEYIRFRRISEDYENFITKQLASKVFVQEVNRIRTVRDRLQRLSPEQRIKNFDKAGRGDHFVFLDFLNEYLDHKDTGKNTGKDKFSRALQKFVSGQPMAEDNFSAVLGEVTYQSELNYFIDALPQVIRKSVNKEFTKFIQELQNQGFLKIGELNLNPRGDVTGSVSNIFQIEDKLGSGANALEKLKEFFWNDMFGSINILQLTVGDLAMYKDTEDVQKRLAQLHAPGMKGNVAARDISSPKQPVSDGLERTIYLKDSLLTSDIIQNLEVVHEQLLKNPKYLTSRGTLNEAGRAYEALLNKVKDAFIHSDHSDGVNWADAQGYSSPTSYRKKMHIFGRWDMQQERAYKRLLEGDFSQDDLSVLWQPLKPFVYTQIGKSNDTDLYMPEIKVGVQNKNSEYLLIMADALMRGMGQKGSLLSVLYDVMEESAIQKPGRGIDTIQFESTVKAGLMGAIDINGMSYSDAKDTLTRAIYVDGNPSSEYNQTYVHEIPFEDYAIQQEVPAHFTGSQQQGSQDRILSIADMSDVNADGAANTVEIAFGDDKPVTMTVHDAKAAYYKAIVENIAYSADMLRKRLGLDNVSQKLQNIALSELLQEEILKDGRYGSDTLWACSTNEMGEFNVPLSDPIQAGRIQQLLNSIIKNTINKQKIAGGPVVQVSSWGSMSNDQLHIRFKDAEGNILMHFGEFQKAKEEGEGSVASYESYKDYLRDKQAQVAYFECYAPVYDERLIQDFGIRDKEGRLTGEIDIQLMEKSNPKLLQMIGYRIPTESKYSMVPLKIVGFLPRRAGEGIMMPAEITTLSGSDFDVDKLYIMRYELTRQNPEYRENELIMAFANKLAKSHKKQFSDTYQDKELFRMDVEALLAGYSDGDFTLQQAEAIRRAYARFKRSQLKYTSKQSDPVKANNNTILDIHWAMLTSPQAVDQFLTPGNFDEPKRVGYLIAASDNLKLQDGTSAADAYARLSKLDIDALKKESYKTKNIIFAGTKIGFHRQNMVAAKLIGVFAQANVSHGFVGLHTDPNGYQDVTIRIPRDKNFTLRDKLGEIHIIDGDVPIDREYTWDGTTRQSAQLASLLAASVDAVKDPILNLMNINMTTVNVAVTLARLGLDIESIAWFLSTPVIKSLVQNFNEQNAENGFTRIDDVLKKMQEDLSKNQKLTFDANFPFDKEFFVSQHDVEAATPQYDYNLLELFSRLTSMSGAFRSITHMTRYNSITSAVGPYAANTMVMKLQDDDFVTNAYIKDSDSLRRAVNNPILRSFRDTAYGLEAQILGSRLVQAGPFMQDVIEYAKRLYGYMNDTLAQDLSEFAMSYYMNMRAPLFDLSFENRDRMTERFVETEYLDLAAPYKDNPFIKSIDRVYKELDPDQHLGTWSLELRTKGMLSENIEDIRAGWSQLYKDEERRIAESAHPEQEENLAIKLLEYNFFRAGLGFDPRTFTSLAPALVKLAIPNYLENLTQTLQEVDGGAHLSNLVYQYMLNTGKINLGRLTDKDMSPLEPADIPGHEEGRRFVGRYLKSITDDLEGIARIPDPNDPETMRYAFISIRGKKGTMTVELLDKLGGEGNDGFEIDPSVDFRDMRSVFVTPAQFNTPAPQGEEDVLTASTSVQDVTPETSDEIKESPAFDRILKASGFEYQGTPESLGSLLKILSEFSGFKPQTKPYGEAYRQLYESFNAGVSYEDIIKTINEQNLCG